MIHHKNQCDLSKQATKIQVTIAPVIDLKPSLHTSYFGRSFQMLSFTLVSNWEPAELPPGDTRNTEATASKNMEQLAPLGPMFQGKMDNSNIKKIKSAISLLPTHLQIPHAPTEGCSNNKHLSTFSAKCKTKTALLFQLNNLFV